MKTCAILVGWAVTCAAALAQPGGPGGFPGGPGGGFGGPPGGTEKKLVKDFDKNNDGWLNAEERKEARVEAKKGGGGGRGPGGGGFGGFGGGERGKPGPKVKVSDAKTFPDAKAFDTSL